MNSHSAIYDAIEMEQRGEDRPLVLLHSLLSDTRAFQHILPTLSANRRVVLPSLPGYGRSPRSTDTIKGVARQLMKARRTRPPAR